MIKATMKKNLYLGIDVGGTWLKGIAFELSEERSLTAVPEMVRNQSPVRVLSRLSANATVNDFIGALDELTSVLSDHDNSGVKGIAISTPGIVDYQGKNLLIAARHLTPLMDNAWIKYLQDRFNATVVIINDAEAASIGAAAMGYLTGNRSIGVMPVGTGLGFSVWRNGRRWTPNFSLPLLGSIYTPAGYYDALASASALADNDSEGNLCNIFSKARHTGTRGKYIRDFAGIVSAAHVLYGVNKVLVGGGLAEAVSEAGFPFAAAVKAELAREALLSSPGVEVEVMPEGNLLPLIGISLLAAGEEKANSSRKARPYRQIHTEVPYNESLRLDETETEELIRLFWNTEQEAGQNLELSLPSIAAVSAEVTARLQRGGRLIYVGAGTSGRLAAIDTVEIACTFGFPRERVITLIAGGVADASIDIETRFEEDASSVPDMLLANVGAMDVVIGVSVSGTAYYVQSALGFARYAGAYTVMIQERDETLPFCDTVIPLRSGNEVLAGSTRMKAGTATKKILNFISTSVMIRLGKVHGCYMTDLECINGKLIERAKHIIGILFGISKEKAYKHLEDHQFNLSRTIESLKKNG
jgi:N-acetylmuramic acid 6-phosphate etherase